VNTRTSLAPDSGPIAWFKAWTRLRRARVLFAYGQVIATRSDPRAARLYRRGLALLDTQPTTLGRAESRDQLRAALGRRGLMGWARAKPRRLQVILLLVGLALMVNAALGWLAPDYAEGKAWRASSAWGTFPITGSMRGEAGVDGRFHTNEEDQPWFRLDLGQVRQVHAIRIENRTNCCRERALPLAIELSTDAKTWTQVGYRRVLFDTFTQQFSTRPARYVRLRIDRRSVLHLRRVSVY
jgi:hypothetical protein